MSGINRILADTNVFIGVMGAPASLLGFLDDEWHYSFISKIELLGLAPFSRYAAPAFASSGNSCSYWYQTLAGGGVMGYSNQAFS